MIYTLTTDSRGACLLLVPINLFETFFCLVGALYSLSDAQDTFMDEGENPSLVSLGYI